MMRNSLGTFSDTTVLLLAGGEGRRLRPLTEGCPKPLAPFANIYRIIDFTLSNAFHSGVDQLYVVTQFEAARLSGYLNRYWSHWSRSGRTGPFAIPLAPGPGRHYRGTCDAVMQNLRIAEREGARDVLVLSADHVYRMDYREMLESHRCRDADATIAVTGVEGDSASDYGVIWVDGDDRVVDFHEKPTEAELDAYGLESHLVNMGVYLFKIEALRSAIDEADVDLGGHLLPRLVQQSRVAAYRFDRIRPAEAAFWADVGTLDSYFQAHKALLEGQFSPDDADWPIRSGMFKEELELPKTAPGSSLVASSAILETADIHSAVIGPGAYVGRHASVSNSILLPGVSIGENTRVHNAIIGEHVRVPEGRSVGMNAGCERSGWQTVTDRGITVLAEAPRPDKEGLPPQGCGLVLLADGDDIGREWARDTLESEGYVVLAVAGAARFIELMIRHRANIQLVICGAALRDTLAPLALQLVRDNLKDVPVAVSVRSEDPKARTSVVCLPDAILTQPFNASQLIGTANRLIRRRAEASKPGAGRQVRRPARAARRYGGEAVPR